MSEKQKIKVSIADRVYPLSIVVSQEERLRQAANSVQQMVKEFEKNYAVSDKQDVLAMCALQFANSSNQRSGLQKQIADSISRLNELIQTIDSELNH